MRDVIVGRLVDAAEQGLPDRAVRWGMRMAIARKLREERRRSEGRREEWIGEWQTGPVALVPDVANRQHYEVPARFFELLLGPRLKYSCCLWEPGTEDIAAAEEAMLEVTSRRAGIEDGMRVLDLGCGWGSLSTWVAERYPGCHVTAVSNSASQGEHLRSRARERGLSNLEHRVVDVNDLDLGERFDRVVSIEMMEHVRNHPELFRRLRPLLHPDGRVFVHVFSHRSLTWPFEDRTAGDWMARTFFSGGIMPSHRLIPEAAARRGFELEEAWIVDGTHYRRTLDAWLDRLDSRTGEVTAALDGVYPDGPEAWVQRWRMFLMACSELFGYADGGEWGVSHYRFRPGAAGSRPE